ncbi:gamma-glutamyl-gamma-aminobutyrate hydrolase family protein [Corynebacterium hindlerae]|uniref:anthranilate synthase n=1 Tax=Corynebacterium hindlerae TaxID=699041 RepID=A0A7G5FCB4_9CORY|nr:gamma-glutamyl-gamma-aminobutyrate hydrolase family protein [Corynebacterium hindlerae]QMV84255.1 gamma-glutamyl-gamma-aminobutyrate hydrolase family protein [Corynebacterium hindlerae]
MRVLIDNFDSFTYNLVDAIGDVTVVRNTATPQQIRELNPTTIILSPGPGRPIMRPIIEEFFGEVPIVGICLGFQAIVEYFGGEIKEVGPVHGFRDTLVSDHPVFAGQSVARYHSLGCTELPDGLELLATCEGIVMAARSTEHKVIGLQFHPESILTPNGGALLDFCLECFT